MAAGFRWRCFERIEIFGRAAHLARWRQVLAGIGRVADAEVVIADDAPPQAADLAIARRVDALLAAKPDFVAIASNDSDFDPDIRRLAEAGIAAARHGDPGPAEMLALVVADLATGDGGVDAALVGERMARLGVPLRGRLKALAAKAGVAIQPLVTGGLRLAPICGNSEQLCISFSKP